MGEREDVGLERKKGGTWKIVGRLRGEERKIIDGLGNFVRSCVHLL